MAQRNSERDDVSTTWATASVKLGVAGLDLREPSQPGALTKALNARFEDDRTIARRHGHTGLRIRDSANYPPLGNSYAVTGEWTYGHGARVSTGDTENWENAHHPIPGRAAGTFDLDGTDVVWTGDRLLVSREGDTALGEHTLWDRTADPVPLKYGHPAFLPAQVDSTPPSTVRGDYLSTALTSRYRLTAHSDAEDSDTLTAWLIDRVTGAVVDTSDVSGNSTGVVDVVAVNSGDVPVVLWRDSDSRVLYINHWTGVQWDGYSVVHTDVYSFDVVPTDAGFYVIWREGSPGADIVKVGRYVGTSAKDVPFVFGATIDPDEDLAPSGAVAIECAPDGRLGVLVEGVLDDVGVGLWCRLFDSDLTPVTDFTLVESGTGYSGGVSIRARGLRDENEEYPWVIHHSKASATGTGITAGTFDGDVLTFETGRRYNSVLATKAFLVGDEVFCWLRADNAGTHYLVGGAPGVQVCGYADREEALERATSDGNYGIPHVWPDPDDEYRLTWARPFNTGQDYPRGGNARIGDLNFLPDAMFVKYGRSVYASGCAVRNWDGVQLGDAGFQDFPTIASNTPANSTGSLTPEGRYYWRVYAVRYNARGERFMSAAVSYGPITLTGAQDTVTLVINTVPCTNHDDVVFEVYRTEDLGSTFYLEGTVDNSLDAATVSFTSGMSDEDLRAEIGDSHAAGVGQLSEVEEWGPLGCEILAVSGDRLWGAGGQVPPGQVQFSKLKEEGEGAGFDTLAGFQTVDTENRPITLVHAMNNTTVVHQTDRLFIVAGTGPDNYGRGAFTIPQIMLADGAVTKRGHRLNQLGALYWGDQGPRLLTTSFQVLNISAPVRSLCVDLEPTGCIADLAEHQAVWYTAGGTALLWNYLEGKSRWAQWSGLPIAGCSDTALATTDGRLLYQSTEVSSDDGQPFGFTWATGKLRGDDVIAGYTLLNSVGVVGAYKGPHRLRARIYYNGSPLWTDEWIWEPETQTWLSSVDDVEDLLPEEVDTAFGVRDHSGAYGTHRKPSRVNCSHFAVEVSDIESDHLTYIPFELALELGSRGGLGRTPVNTFTNTVGR